MYVPPHCKIPDKICIVESNTYNGSQIGKSNDPIGVSFSPNIASPPVGTIAIVDNLFKGPLRISEIYQGSATFYCTMEIENALPSNTHNIIIESDIKYWSINEIIMSGLVGKNGLLPNGTGAVVVTYSSYYNIILKDGALYKKILGV